MSLTVDGVWKAGVWAATVWAAGVWYEPASGTHTTSGNLVGPGSAITASVTHIGTHATSGALVGAGSQISGTVTHNVTHDTSGDLVGSGSRITGSVQFGTAVAKAGGAGTPRRVSKKVYIEQDGKVLLFASASDASRYVFAEQEKAKAKASGKSIKPATKDKKAKVAPKPVEIDIAALEAQQAEQIARDEALAKQETIRQLLAKQDFETLLELQVKYRLVQDEEDDLFLLMVT